MGPWARPRLARDAAGAFAAAALAALALVLTLRLWRADLAVPFSDQGDGLFNTMLVKGLAEGGWWTHNASLGFPAGQDLHDFAMGGDHLHMVFLWLFAVVTGSAGAGLNVFFGFAVVLSAVLAYAVLRWMGVDVPVAVVIAVLFALTPYALVRGEGHITLVTYPVPVGAWLALATWRGERMVARRRGGGRGPLAWASRRSLLTLAACVAVGSAGSFYYASFTVALVLAAGAARAMGPGRLRAAAPAVVVCALVVVVTLVNLAPTTLYALEHGRNASIAQRTAGESEFYALKLAQLVLPVEDHRIGVLDRLQERYESTSVPAGPVESYGATLGAVGTAGLVWLLAVAVAALGAARPRVDERHRHLAAATVTALLLGTLGGIGSLVAYLATPQLRGWNRVSAFIAFFALAAVALLLTALARRLRGRRAGVVVVPLLLVVLAAGLLDQTTNALVPAYAQQQERFREDERLVRAIEATLRPGSAVLQLPPMPFPEATPIGGVTDYAPVRAYLHSDDLRWSYGAMRGRPEDWHGTLANRPVSAVLASAVATGFAGIWLDRAGYADPEAEIEAELRARLGPPQVTGEDGRVAFYPLADYARRLREAHPGAALAEARRAALRPVRVSVPSAPVARAPGAGEAVWDVTAAEVYLALDSPHRSPRPARVSLTFERARDGAALDVELPGRPAERAAIGRERTRLERDVVLAPGRSGVILRRAAGTSTPFRVRVGVSDRALLIEPRARAR